MAAVLNLDLQKILCQKGHTDYYIVLQHQIFRQSEAINSKLKNFPWNFRNIWQFYSFRNNLCSIKNKRILFLKQVGLSRATLEFSFNFSFWADQSLVWILEYMHNYISAYWYTRMVAYLHTCILACILAYWHTCILKK